MNSRIAIVVLLLATLANAQESSVAATERKAVAESVAAKRLCGSTEVASSSTSANSRIEATAPTVNSPCGPVIHPFYPQEAKEQHIQGAVHLKAVIGIDGTIRELRVIDGYPLLAPAAMEAVKTWKYKPYYTNGKPVEMETTITVNFTLQSAAGGDR